MVDAFFGEGAVIVCPDDEEAGVAGGFVEKEFSFILNMKIAALVPYCQPLYAMSFPRGIGRFVLGRRSSDGPCR